MSAAAIGALAAAVGATPAMAQPDYPSWDDVENAQASEEATAAEVAKISDILLGLERAAADAGRRAQIADERFRLTSEELDHAALQESELSEAADAAESRARVSKMRAGLVAAHLARSAAQDLGSSLVFDASHAEDLLYQLGTMTKLSGQTQVIYDEAITDRNAAESLRAQAAVAAGERAKLAAQAEQTREDSAAAARAAGAALAEQQEKSEQLFEQLATLKRTTARAEAEYFAGQVAQQQAEADAKAAAEERVRAEQATRDRLAADRAADKATADKAAADKAGDDEAAGEAADADEQDVAPAAPVAESAPEPVAEVPAPIVGKAAAAIAYARKQIGDRYALGGSGPSSWDCSGLTLMSYSSVGIALGTHSATNQYRTARAKGQLVPLSQLEPGDLLWYSEGDGDMYHVTIYSGNGKMIEAPYAGVPVREVPMRYYDLVSTAGRPTA